MAILGLRALYFALAAMIHRFHYLKYALATFLIFIGAKIFVADFLLAGGKFPTWVSLGVTLVLIAVGVGYSLWKTRGAPEPDWPAGRRPDKPAGVHSLDKGLQDGTLLDPGRAGHRWARSAACSISDLRIEMLAGPAASNIVGASRSSAQPPPAVRDPRPERGTPLPMRSDALV